MLHTLDAWFDIPPAKKLALAMIFAGMANALQPGLGVAAWVDTATPLSPYILAGAMMGGGISLLLFHWMSHRLKLLAVSPFWAYWMATMLATIQSGGTVPMTALILYAALGDITISAMRQEE